MARSKLTSAASTTRVQQGGASIVVGHVTGRIELDRLADQIDGPHRVSGGSGGHAQQMQCIEVPGLHLQDLFVDLLRAQQLSCIVAA